MDALGFLFGNVNEEGELEDSVLNKVVTVLKHYHYFHNNFVE